MARPVGLPREINFAHDSIAFSKSTDGGLTWSQPIQINRTPTLNISSGNQQAFTPAIRVAAEGTIAVTYYDFRNNTSDPTTLPTDAFIVHCHASAKADSCTHPSDWASETRLTPTSFDMRNAPVARGFFLGDYEALTVVGSDFFRLVFVGAGSLKGTSEAETRTQSTVSSIAMRTTGRRPSSRPRPRDHRGRPRRGSPYRSVCRSAADRSHRDPYLRRS
jgi:hypothetical protein